MAFSIRTIISTGIAALALYAAPATAKVASAAPNGFSVVQLDDVDASPAEIWSVLAQPALWWNPDHSFTGEAIYFTLDVKPGGCFCEKIPAGETEGGGIRHFTVVYVDKPRVLRLEGGLGPLQSEAVAATMTFAIEPRDEGSVVSLSYTVGGYMRSPVPDLAQSLDQVTGEALARLKAVAEGRDPAKAVYVAEPFPASRSAPQEAAVDKGADAAEEVDSAQEASETSSAETVEEATTEAEADERPSLSRRLELQLDDAEDVELAGQDREAESEEPASPKPVKPLPDGSR